MWRRAAWAAVLAAGLGGCGGGSPTRPETVPRTPTGLSAGATLTVLAGATGAPVAGALVTVAGQVVTTDAAGRARVPAAAPVGALVDVTHPSHLDRQTVVRAGMSDRITLWPRTTPQGLDENYTATLVYTTTLGEGTVAGSVPLVRLPLVTDTIVVEPSAELSADPEAVQAHEAAARDATNATGGRVRVVLAGSSTPVGNSVRVTTRVSQAETGCADSRARAYTVAAYTAFTVVRAEIVYCDASIARGPTVLHEIGHVFGLRHAPAGTNDLMEGSFSPQRATTLGARESLVLRLMLERTPGNQFPDTDRGVSASSARSERRFVCY